MFKTLVKRVDNAPLIAFRICFGFLMAWQSFYDVYEKNTINVVYVKPKNLFPFIGFEWLRPLPGDGMHYYHAVMGVTGLGIMLGLFYRYSLAAFTIMYTALYLMQKTWYNNHHYLIILLCLIMFLMPAERYASLDCRRNPGIKRYSMPQWCTFIIIAQLAIVYTFASVAKMYPDWFDGTYARISFAAHRNPRYLFITQNHYFHLFITWGGLLFDLLIVPLLLIKRTRILATCALLFFHCFNFMTLDIGIFPALSISFLPFFYPADSVRKFLFPNKPAIPLNEIEEKIPVNATIVKYVLLPYLVVQLFLPVRHFFIKGNVLYTEEGHRMSWRMKQFIKGGSITFRVRELPGEEETVFDLKKLYTGYQIRKMKARPDMVWQAAQLIKQTYAARGKKVAVYATVYISLNEAPKRLIIDPKADLASVKWDYFWHSPWVLENDY